MTYHPPPPSQPNGCIQTLAISRMIVMILAVPILLILGMLIGVILIFVALDQHPLLGLAAILTVGLLLYLVAKWEHHRVGREQP